MKILFYLSTVLLLLSSCNAEPTPINYGSDACSFCKMNIVERKFGGEIVTQKGKITKYDAIECVINTLSEKKEEDLKYIMAIDYNNPTELIDARTSYHLKSKKIPSPMGAFLSSYSTLAQAKIAQEQNGGEILDWKTLKTRYKNP